MILQKEILVSGYYAGDAFFRDLGQLIDLFSIIIIENGLLFNKSSQLCFKWRKSMPDSVQHRSFYRTDGWIGEPFGVKILLYQFCDFGHDSRRMLHCACSVLVKAVGKIIIGDNSGKMLQETTPVWEIQISP